MSLLPVMMSPPWCFGLVVAVADEVEEGSIAAALWAVFRGDLRLKEGVFMAPPNSIATV